MALEVIKRDGSREPFDAKKIRKAITTAAKLAKLFKKRQDEMASRRKPGVWQKLRELL